MTLWQFQNKQSLHIPLAILDVHPLFLVFSLPLSLSSFSLLLLPLEQLYFHLCNGLLDLFVDDFAFIFDLVILFKIILAFCYVSQFEGAERQHVDDFKLATHVFVQFFEQIPGLLELLHLDEILSSGIDGLTLVLLSVFHYPLMDLSQLTPCTLKVVPPHLVVRNLQLHVNATTINLRSLFHGFLALRFGFLFVDEVSEADFSYAGVGLGNVPFDLSLRSG